MQQEVLKVDGGAQQLAVRRCEPAGAPRVIMHRLASRTAVQHTGVPHTTA
ncbi:hypothetical protein [Variovorax gossypii]